MIVISSHIDNIYNRIMPLQIGNYTTGLLDNLLGNIVVYNLLQFDNILKLIKENKLEFYFNTLEEFGMLDDKIFDLLEMYKDITIINVDVCVYKENEYDVIIDNVYNIDTKVLEEFCEFENINAKINKIDLNNIESEDDCYQFAKLNIPCLSIIIPIHNVNDSWHRTDCFIETDKIRDYTHILNRIICLLM